MDDVPGYDPIDWARGAEEARKLTEFGWDDLAARVLGTSLKSTFKTREGEMPLIISNNLWLQLEEEARQQGVEVEDLVLYPHTRVIQEIYGCTPPDGQPEVMGMNFRFAHLLITEKELEEVERKNYGTMPTTP